MTRQEKENQMIEMNITNPIDEAKERVLKRLGLEDSLRKTRKEQMVDYSQAVGKTLVPIGVIGGISVLSNLFANEFESHDIQTLIKYGLPFAAGAFLGSIGVVAEYLDWFRESIDDIRYASQRVRDYRTQIKTLEQQALEQQV